MNAPTLKQPTLDPVPVLRAEVAASRAKLQRIREAVAAKATIE